MKEKSLIFALCLLLFAAGGADAAKWHSTNTLLANAVPDECYAGLGGIDYPTGITPGDGFSLPETCPSGSVPKTNDTYVWALTEQGDSLWFASAANVMCTTAGVFMEELSYGEYSLRLQRDPNRYETHAVCEHGDSMVARTNSSIYGAVGDWRPSKLFRWIKETPDKPGELIELTTQIEAIPTDRAIFDTILGIRAAGSHNGVVFFAGGSQLYSGVYFFAFRASDGRYLGYRAFSNYRQIRKMIVVNNQLYTGVAASTGVGQILRWHGSLTDLWNWQVVGRVTGSVTELSEYVDRFGRTRIVANAAGGLYVSPAIWGTGLTTRQAYSWRRVWSSADYEPDSTTRMTYGPGAVARLGGWVYWGTMHIPFHAYYMAATFRYGGIDNVPQEQQYPMYYGTHRATTIWRGRYLESANPEIQCLYGETHLGAWNSASGTYESVPTGWTPVNMPPSTVPHPFFGTPMGSSGFFNPYNNYSWDMVSHNDGTGQHLFVGTMDQTLINTGDVSDLYPFNAPGPFIVPNPDPQGRGADLWRFSLSGSLSGATATTAEAEFNNGAGNLFNYGVRCLISSADRTKLYLGMANYANLRHPGVEPYLNGGWELRELSR